MAPPESAAAAPLRGLVLAGGRSRRMGRDKGALRFVGQPQVVRAHALLCRVLENVDVSVRADQAAVEPYAGLPLVIDDGSIEGPAAGLLAAWSAAPEAALCVLAVDLPRVGLALLEQLVEGREPAAVATAFAHPDGTLEPLCTIWEPAARTLMRAPAPGSGISLRRVLEAEHVHVLRPAEPAQLESVNAPGQARRAGAQL